MGRFRGHGGCRPRECPRAGPGGAPPLVGGGGGRSGARGGGPPGAARGAGRGGAGPAELQGRYALWAVRAPGTGREGSAS